jgi:sulfite exporter TauE/SafE
MDDLRRPIGILFGTLGLILLLYGIFSPDVRAALDSDINVNLECGIILVVFGGIMLWLSLRPKRS